MTDSVLIFTFSPVQPFIVEARRAADLYAGSQILVQLAKSAASAIEKDHLIFPAKVGDDVPNRIVARLPFNACDQVAQAAREALLKRWREIAGEARAKFLRKSEVDPAWEDIWKRQMAADYLWEVYWAAASLEGRSYSQAYQEADCALSAVKRTRAFIAADEPGLKDTLSGRRQALRTKALPADAYWKQSARNWAAAKLRPNGRERLDAIGLVKRFSSQAELKVGNFDGFPSTSSVASLVFLEQARGKAQHELGAFKQALDALYTGFINLQKDPYWTYDGDLLYRDTLAKKRLEDDYGVTGIGEQQLNPLRKQLQALYEAVGEPPSPYYAVIVLDGDNMGKFISACQTEEEHRQFSRKLSQFAARVPAVAADHHGFVVFNGGDDVLAIAPLATAYELARQLAAEFHRITGGTASAGMAVTHHQSPLSTALRAARQAEGKAKQIDADKAAVCILAMKRSGETLEMRSKWEVAGDKVDQLVRLLKAQRKQNAPLASRFVYDFARSAYALPNADEMLEAELRRLLIRHRNEQHPDKPDPVEWATRLKVWAAGLPEGPAELSRWLIFARFIAQGGGE
ncbi:MAG: type III-B CRISPR-associated protein Cas10/Cmr2 [Chloroflexi bacterium RBG_16_58_14]|nr:MAG: type III-B CRISPR-associated protein Cas10/Cmr2 [Chloroflexi bacterium RBG_16_58_14]